MSWLKALENVSQRATRGASHKIRLRSLSSPMRFAPASAVAEAPLDHASPSTAALHNASDMWRSSLAVIQLSQTLSAPPSNSNALVKPESNLSTGVHQLPLRLAAKSVAILLNAGQVHAALAAIHQWAPPPRPPRHGARHSAARELRKAIRTLGTICDVETLRALFSVLRQSTAEQQQRRAAQAAAWTSPPREAQAQSCGKDAAESITATSPTLAPLLTALGPRHTHALLVAAAHAIVSQDESIVPLHAKLSHLEAVATAAPGPPHVPFVLQEEFARLVAGRPGYDARLLRLAAPSLVSATAFAPPWTCNALRILCATKKELRRLKKRGVFSGTTTRKRNAALVDVLCGAPCMYEKELRAYILSQLRSPHVGTRRAWAVALLRRPLLLRRLHISPAAAFASCGLSFRSYEPRGDFAAHCLRALRLLRRAGRDMDAARLAWNHLSTPGHTISSLFARHPRSLDAVVASMCCAMRGGRFGAWAGHRSLALLRAAAPAGLVAPSHVIPTGAAALDCGVHFAAVQQFVHEMFGAGSEMSSWVLDMARISAGSHRAVIRVAAGHPAQSTALRSMLRRHRYKCEESAIASPPMVELGVPSRSKLLALWSLIKDENMSEALRRLTCRVFLDDVAYRCFCECELNVRYNTGKNEQKQLESEHGEWRALDRLFREEIFASVAANCTTDDSYTLLMEALVAQRRKHNAERCLQLFWSEVEKTSMTQDVPQSSDTIMDAKTTGTGTSEAVETVVCPVVL